jgi:hypothetical protein
MVGVLTLCAIAHPAYRLIGPMLTHPGAMGFHDWDGEASYRYITTLSLLKHHELPWWHPYFCGGFPAWGSGEMATNLVSPFLPAYLFLPISLALRVEIVGSAALSLFATWLFVGRFTQNAGLRALAAIAYTLNGRYALQMASGHAWHMAFAWTPLVLYAFDVSLERGRLRMACWAGAAMAMMVYTGGIYPLPHTAILVIGYAILLAIGLRSLRPLVAMAITGATSLGLAAPKLLPIVEVMGRWPRIMDSYEAIDLPRLYEMLANPDQAFTHGPVAVPQFGWHEYGIYVGPAVVACMVLAVLASGGAKFGALRAMGILFFVLGLGTFHRLAPWTLLHKLPAFSSQHVPTRFLYIGVLMLVAAFAAFVGSTVDQLDRRVPWVSLLFLFPAWRIGLEMADVGAQTTKHVFYMEQPKVERLPDFVQVARPEYDFTPPDSRAAASILAMQRNEGFVECDNVPNDAQPRGAIARGTPKYRGEAYLEDGVGTARITHWTTNGAVVEVTGGSANTVLVYNMNWDPGWSANGAPALDVGNAVATVLPSGSGRVEFRYRPRTIGMAMLAFLATLLALALTHPAAISWLRTEWRRRFARAGQLAQQ